MSNIKQELHKLIDKLSDNEVEIVLKFVKFVLIEKKSSSLFQFLESVSVDDEPLTDEEIKSIEESEKSIETEGTISMEDLKYELERF